MTCSVFRQLFKLTLHNCFFFTVLLELQELYSEICRHADMFRTCAVVMVVSSRLELNTKHDSCHLATRLQFTYKLAHTLHLHGSVIAQCTTSTQGEKHICCHPKTFTRTHTHPEIHTKTSRNTHTSACCLKLCEIC